MLVHVALCKSYTPAESQFLFLYNKEIQLKQCWLLWNTWMFQRRNRTATSGWVLLLFVCWTFNIWFIEEMISHVKCLEHKSLVGISCDRSKRSLQKLDQPAYYTMSTQKDQCFHIQIHTINTLVSLTLLLLFHPLLCLTWHNLWCTLNGQGVTAPIISKHWVYVSHNHSTPAQWHEWGWQESC